MTLKQAPSEQLENDSKFKELLLFICKRSEGDSPFGATKLNKLLFFSDFLAFRRFGKSITGHKYQKLKNGPTPRLLVPLMKQLQDEGSAVQAVRDYHGHEQKRTLALREPNLDLFDAKEITLVADLIEEFWGRNATQISESSHEFRGWQLAEDGEEIPYEVAAVEFEQQSEADLDLGKEFDRARQVIAGAEWSIRRAPKSDGVWIKKIDVWRAKLLGPGFPSHFIYYAFDDETIRFLAIKRCDE